MRSSFHPATLVLALGLLGASHSSAAEPTPDPAAELFQTLKCQLCHAVPAAGIEAKAKSAKVRGADLGTAANQLDAEQMTAFLQQQSAIDDQQHKKEFKGTDEELATLVEWLLRLTAVSRAEQQTTAPAPPGEQG